MPTSAVKTKPVETQYHRRSYTEAERAAFYRRVAEIQEHVMKLVPPGVSLADELIEERRAEARREELKWSQEF